MPGPLSDLRGSDYREPPPHRKAKHAQRETGVTSRPALRGAERQRAAWVTPPPPAPMALGSMKPWTL